MAGLTVTSEPGPPVGGGGFALDAQRKHGDTAAAQTGTWQRVGRVPAEGVLVGCLLFAGAVRRRRNRTPS
ncbi:MAG TPA: hypothetical protein VH912_29995 [Streptosporangiaceae bacterium]|jgi:hypothetical protein